MRRTLVHFLVIAFACSALLVGASSRAGNLVTADWLRSNLAREDLLLIDASSARLYAAKHIPGAISVDLYTYGSPHKVTSAEMERRMQAWGVSPGKKIVLYDQGASMEATWLFYELHYHGYPAEGLHVLDGGLAKWEATGGAVTKDATPPPKPGSFRVTQTKEDQRVRLAEFVTASGDPAKHTIVDALEPSNYFGATKFFDRAGHVPNAVMLPVSDFFNADKTFKSASEIRTMATHVGVTPERQIHSHCGGGVAATVPYFALKFLAGYPNVKVYKESQMEWLQDERGLPMWTYDAPFLKRDGLWLNGWSNRMMRIYGVTQLSVIDVRAPEAYKQGHVPFALNLPADLFRDHVGNPAKLAAILGPAGVDPTHEAVVVSAGGLNPNAALAFLMLEKLGQQKVSLLMDSVDDWGFRGLPLTKEATAVGPKKSPMDVSIPPIAFKADLRKDVMIKDAAATKGPYPKLLRLMGFPDVKVLVI